MIKLVLPAHLNTLAGTRGEVQLAVGEPATLRAVMASLEAQYPPLTGTVIDPAAGRRRPFVRFFMCGEDWSHHDLDVLLPDPVLRGEEPLLIIGAIAGGAIF